MNKSKTSRYPLPEIKKVWEKITQNQEVVNLLNAVSTPLVLTLPNRQIIFANNSFKEFAQAKSEIIGKFLGEALGCINPQEFNSECGQTNYCPYCGANKAFNSLENNDIVIEECHILSKKEDHIDTFDIKVDIRKISINNVNLFLINIFDLKSQMRRLVLRNYILYKVIDSISTVKLSIDFASEECSSKYINYASSEIKRVTNNLKKYRILCEAEENKLKKNYSFFSSLDILKHTIQKVYELLEENEKRIEIDPKSDNINFWSDFELLELILENMLTNALIHSTGSIFCGTNYIENKITFWVENQAKLEEETIAKLFKPIYSEHGVSIGVGTYLIKIIGEKILKGKVYFKNNSKENKITFYLDLHLQDNKLEYD